MRRFEDEGKETSEIEFRLEGLGETWGYNGLRFDGAVFGYEHRRLELVGHNVVSSTTYSLKDVNIPLPPINLKHSLKQSVARMLSCTKFTWACTKYTGGTP